MNKRILIITTIVLVLDQLSKNLIEAYINLSQMVNLIPNFFSLTNANNYGAAWSILYGHLSLLIVFSCIALFSLAVYTFLPFLVLVHCSYL